MNTSFDYSFSKHTPDSLIAEEIRRDEKILWQGQPNKRRYLLRGAWYTIPFSIMWGGFAIFWEVSAISFGAPFFFWLWGIPFVLVGCYSMFGRYFYESWVVDGTRYALTDKRVLMRSGGFRTSVVDIPLANMPHLQMNAGSDGYGTIVFEQLGYGNSFMNFPQFANRAVASGFYTIPDVREVFRLTQDARSAVQKG